MKVMTQTGESTGFEISGGLDKNTRIALLGIVPPPKPEKLEQIESAIGYLLGDISTVGGLPIGGGVEIDFMAESTRTVSWAMDTTAELLRRDGHEVWVSEEVVDLKSGRTLLGN
jgi:hypothetical protein